MTFLGVYSLIENTICYPWSLQHKYRSKCFILATKTKVVFLILFPSLNPRKFSDQSMTECRESMYYYFVGIICFRFMYVKRFSVCHSITWFKSFVFSMCCRNSVHSLERSVPSIGRVCKINFTVSIYHEKEKDFLIFFKW